MIYSWLLFGLVAFDTISTLIGIQYFGASEANPLMAWMMSESMLLVLAFKLGTVGAYIYLAQRSGKVSYVKFAFWAYLAIYLTMTAGLNCQGYL